MFNECENVKEGYVKDLTKFHNFLNCTFTMVNFERLAVKFLCKFTRGFYAHLWYETIIHKHCCIVQKYGTTLIMVKLI